MGVADGNLGRRAKMTRVFQRFLDTCSRRSHRAHGFPPNVVVFLKNCCVLVFFSGSQPTVRLYQPRDYMGAYCDIEATASATLQPP